MAKFFVCSDIHSAYAPWMTALSKAGFDKNNDNHKIIVCGDLFDRMDESQQVYDFAVDMINKGKLIYIKGNHESLMEDCLQRKYPRSHDWHNGTAKTIVDLAPNADTFDDACDIAYAKLKPLFDKTVDYFETEKFIFCHSFIPTKDDSFDPDWRCAHASAWEEARWGNPLFLAMDGLNQTGKVIIAGHWHCSTGWALENKTFDEFGKNACFDPYYYKDKLIMIDACVAHTNKINVLIIED